MTFSNYVHPENDGKKPSEHKLCSNCDMLNHKSRKNCVKCNQELSE